MNRPTKKFIAFSTALVSMIGLMAPMSASAAYEAELMEKCEYDELIEMRDKAILIKDGNDYTVNDATQLVVIDSNGEKKLISKEEGLNSIYNYVTTTRGLYNFISPTNDPYSFDFFDENYRISTESGVIIAGFNDKFALMDADGKKLSAEYDAIYRISDDYFMVDVINGDKRSTGLIKSDGSVIAAPAEGVGEFYLCGNKFLVSDYKTEIIERENWLGEIVQEEQVVYTYRFMSLDGKTENETFIGFTELGHNYNIPSFDASDRDHFSSDLRYEVDYAFENDCIALTYADDKQVIYNSKTETFSDKYDSVQGISADKFVVSTDGVYAVVDTEYKALIDGAENMTFYKTLQVKKDGKVTEYDTELNVIEELNIEKIFPTFENPTIETNGNIVTVNSDESYWGYPTIDTEYVSTSVNVEITPVWKNSDVEVSLYEDYTSDFDFQLDVFEEYYDESAGYTVTTSNRYKYVLDSLYQPHDVSEYARVSENINHDVVVLQKEDGYLDYVNFADAKDKKDLSAYKYLTPVDNHILGNAYYSEREQIGYCLKTDDSFAVSDMNFNLLTEPVEGTPSAVKISCKDNVYSGAVEFYVNSGTGSNSVNKYGVMSLEKGVVIPAVYDSVSVGYGGYLVTQNGQTTVMNENGEAVKEFDGAYSFNSITGCVYDADWNLVKRDN
ncbi:MAG: hypothetical protein IJA12_01255, partial [Oscillospiraceae bacterium]|nr:hypothetical protein [Oscillospiraceae bacterium]